jgi:hypothetical protein
MCAVNKPKLRERKIGVMVRFVQCKIKAGRSPCENERELQEGNRTEAIEAPSCICD